jgi:hypothetical protein
LMKRALAAMLLCGLAGCPKEDPLGDVWGFIGDFRASHFLSEAVRLQKLGAPAREAALRELARQSHKRASDVFPLCRMLFEAKEGKEFRRPLIGGAGFVGKTDYANWPLEPITIYKGVPILIVTGYILAGVPELPLMYLEYCIETCKWREEKFSPVDQESRRRILSEFIKSNSLDAREVNWLRAQAE